MLSIIEFRHITWARLCKINVFVLLELSKFINKNLVSEITTSSALF